MRGTGVVVTGPVPVISTTVTVSRQAPSKCTPSAGWIAKEPAGSGSARAQAPLASVPKAQVPSSTVTCRSWSWKCGADCTPGGKRTRST